MSSQSRTQQANKRGGNSARGRGGYGGRGRGGRRNQRFKKPKKSPPKKIDWKTYIAPGSTKYFETLSENKIEKDYEKMIRLKRWEAESQGVDERYLPRTAATINTNNEKILDMTEMLGWEYDVESNKFYNNQYNNTPFNAMDYRVLKNGEVSKIPIDSKDKDSQGICFIQEVSNDGSFKTVKQNDWSVFWDTRRGKRYAKYIQYRKKREEKKNSLLGNKEYNDEPKTSDAWKE